MRIAYAGLLFGLCALPVVAQEGRNMIERMVLDTPEAAAAAFIDAFVAKDFLSLYYMLSPEAKQTFGDNYFNFNAALYFKPGENGEVVGSILEDGAQLYEGPFADIISDPALIFDNIMFHANAYQQLPFSLDGASVVGVDGADGAAVKIALDGATPASVHLEAVIIHNGDWRIDRVVWDGSDAELKPWGAGEPKVKTR